MNAKMRPCALFLAAFPLLAACGAISGSTGGAAAKKIKESRRDSNTITMSTEAVLVTKHMVSNAHAALPDAKSNSPEKGVDAVIRDTRPIDANSLRTLACDAKAPETLPFRSLRLTNFQLKASLADAFGAVMQTPAVSEALKRLPSDVRKHGFDSHQRFTEAQRFTAQMTFAKALAQATLASDANLRILSSSLGVACQPTVGMAWSGCGATVANALSARLKRRTPDASETARLKSVFDKAVALGASNTIAWKGVVASVLVSPEFLYATDTRATGGTLDARAVGTRLSLAVAGKLPDAALLADMANGKILAPETRASHATRLLGTEAAKKAFSHFAAQWFGLPTNDISPTDYPGKGSTSPDAYRDAIATDFQAATSKPVFEGQGRFVDFLSTSTASPAHPWLADAYGTPESTQPTTLPDERRGNIFARVGFLSTKNGGRNLPHRGIFVLERMLCSPLGAPPPDAVAAANAISTVGLTHREAWDATTASNNCKGCHVQINPMGAIFDEFDGWGRYEATETIRTADGSTRQVPWNTASKMTIPGGAVIDVKGPGDLAQALGDNDVAKACFAVNWVDYAFAFENKSNCMLKAAALPLFENTDGGIKDMIVRVVSSPEFLKR